MPNDTHRPDQDASNYRKTTKPTIEISKQEIEEALQSIEDLGGQTTHDLLGMRQDQLAELQKFRLTDLDIIPPDGLAIIVRGQDDPIIIENVQRIVLGRDVRASDFSRVIDLAAYSAMEKGVSRKHAMLASVSGIYYLNDMASTNGTWLNGNRLMAFRSHELKPGDWVRLGNLELRIYFKPAQEVLTINLLPKLEMAGKPPQLFTPRYLAETVVPFMEAVDNIQKIIDEVTDTPPTEIALRHISGPPITISMAHGSQAIRLIREHVEPWETAHQALLNTTAIRQAQVELAETMLKAIKPDIPGDMKQAAVEKLVRCINSLMNSSLKLAEEKPKQAR